MKKLLLSAWLMMLSIAAMAQTIVIIDKEGNRIPYDPTEITCIEFQAAPPGFTVNSDKGSFLYQFDNVKSIQGTPNFVFVSPDIVNVDGEGEELAVYVKSNVEFDVAISDPWITFGSDAQSSMYYVKVAKNPSLDERTAKVTLTSKDGTLASTLNVVQAGKEDSRYIPVDWETDQLDDFDMESGVLQVSFADEVPIIGEYDVMVVPYGAGSVIRVINEVTKTEGKTVTMQTEKGDLGDLFKDVSFSLEFGEGSSSSVNGGEASARSRNAGYKPVYRPVKVAEFDGEKYVEIQSPTTRSNGPRRIAQQLALNYDGSGTVLWEEKNGDEEIGKLSLDSYKSNLNLTGNVDFEFKKERKGRLWHGNITKGGISISGNSEAEIVPNFKCNADRVLWIPKGKATLENKVVTRKYTFEIQGIMLDLYFDVDMLCNYEFEAEGLVDVTAGHKKTHSLKYGWSKGSPVDWTHEEKDVAVTAVNKKWSIGYPYTDSRLELSLLAYPRIRVSVMGENCGVTDFLPKEEVIINTTATPVMTGNPYLNKKLHHQYRSSTDYILYAFLDFENDTTIAGEPTDIAIIPQQLEMVSDKQIWVMENDEQEVKFRVTHKDYNTGQFVPSAGALVMFNKVSEDDPIEFPEAPAGVNKQKNYAYADENGYVTSKIKLLPTESNAVFYEATLIDPPDAEVDFMERGIVGVLRHDLQCLNPEQEIDENTESVPVTFELKRIKGALVESVADQMVEFTVVNGTVEPLKEKTNAEGRVTVSFKPDKDATEGSVKALTYIRGNVRDWVGTATGKITIKQSRPSKEKAKPKIRIYDSGESGGSKPKVIDDNGNGEIVFVVDERIEGEETDRPVEGATVEFETDNQDDNLEGFSWATTGKDGKASAKFKVKDFAKFKGVKIKAKATVKYSDGEKEVETTAKVNSDGTLDDGSGSGGDVFDKAKKLDDNVYIVRDKDGNESTRGLLQSWSQWNRGKSYVDGETRVFKVSLEDGKVDEETGSVDTQGGGYFEIPIDQFGEPLQLLLEYLSNYGAINGSFFTFKNPEDGYSSSNYLNLKFGGGDMHNLKSGTLLLQKKSSPAKARAKAPLRALEEDYSGELELVFAFTFTNYIYDEEAGQEVEDAEYTVYGKAVVNEYVPQITYFKLEPESGFVGVGKSVVVNTKEYSDEDAVWNWDDVELVASYVDYANYETDEGYFSWDPATHSLTSLKSNNNESVYVRFRLKSNPELTSYFTIRTGDGWPYTAFTISPADQTVEHGYTCQFNIESWEPADIAWNPYAIEIDPATNLGAYNKYFIYEPGFPRFRCSYAAEAGTYDVRMRLMSDHSVGFTMKITVTE